MPSFVDKISGQTASFARRRRRWFYGLGAALVIYALLGFLLAPWLVEKFAVDAVRTNLGSELTLEDVAINPFVLSLTVDGLELDDPAGEPLSRVRQIFVNFQLSSIFRRAWTFAEIRFDAPEFFLARDSEGVLNVAKLMPADGSKPPPEKTGERGMPRLFIHEFSVNEARIDWRDDVPPEPVATVFGPVSVEVQKLNTLPEQPGDQSVVIVTETEGTLAWSGSLQLNPVVSAGHASLKGSHFPLLSAYIRHETGLDVVDGLVDLEFDYAISAADGDVRASLDNLAVIFTGVRVNTFDPAPDDPTLNGRELLVVPDLELTGGSFRWPEREIAVSAFELKGVVVELLRLESGDLDIVKRTAAPAAPEPAGDPPAADPAGEWRITLDRLALADAAVRLTDRSVEPNAELGFEAIDLMVEKISNEPDAAFPTALSLEASRGGTIRIDGTTTVLPAPVLEYDLAVDGVALAGAHPYLKPLADVNLDSGTVGVQGRLRHAPDELLLFEADADILDFLITETDEGTRLGSWDRLHFDGIALSLTGKSLGISEIALQAPFADVLIAADGSVNLGRISKDDGAEELVDEVAEENPQTDGEPAETAEKPPLAVTIGRVVIGDAAGIFTDESLPLPFTANIAGLAGTLSTIATDSTEPSAVDLEGQVDEYGLVRITGSVTPLDFARNTDLDVVFENVSIPKFSAYTIRFAGREIESGKLDLDLGYELQDSRLVGENKIVLREFELGDKVPHPDAMSLPLGLAVALLKDSSGTIDIDLPIRGDLNDPAFGYGRVIGKALLNLITKIVTSPFALLGNLVGAEAEELEYINFAAGRADLAPPEVERAKKLAEALALRPELTLEIQGAVDRDADVAALQRSRVEAAIEERMASSAEGGEDDLNYAERRRETAEAMYLESTGNDPAALEALKMQFTSTVVDEENGRESEQFDATAYAAELERRLVETVDITESDLAELARSRAENARDAVIAANPELEGRVSVVEDIADGSGGSGDAVRVKVSLSAGE